MLIQKGKLGQCRQLEFLSGRLRVAAIKDVWVILCVGPTINPTSEIDAWHVKSTRTAEGSPNQEAGYISAIL